MSAPRLAWALWALAMLMVVPGPVLQTVVGWKDEADLLFLAGFIAMQVGTATTGAVVASRVPRNSVGWIFLGMGVGLALALSSGVYADLGLTTDTGPLPGDDAAAWISAACRQAACAGPLSWYGGGGLLWVGRGDVLPDQQRHLVGFGSAGLHWKAFPRVTLAAQIDGHTPFYNGSELRPLGYTSLQLVLGGMWRLQDRHTAELAITEDLAVDTAPDVVVRLGLRSWF